MNAFDELELTVARHAPLTSSEIEEVAARQVLEESSLPLRHRVAAVLANLSYRIDPSIEMGPTRLLNN